jgi:hypothetical protein
MIKRFCLFLAVCTAVSLLGTVAVGQNATTGSLVGTVTDSSGAVVPNATVTATNPGTGATQTTQTTGQGYYRFPVLQPGEYVLSVSATGMAKIERNATVDLGKVNEVNLKLGVAGSSTTVEVSGEVPLIETENANLATSYTQSQISSLPNPGNDVTAYAYSAPGVVQNTGSGYGNFSAYGLPSTANLFTTNGNDNMDPYLNLNNSGASNLALGANELSEIAVVNNGYTAEYGRQAGAQMNASTKSGTNQFHGNALYWWNGRALNANEYFLKGSEVAAGTPNVRSFANNNAWAASFGGPIKKNKLFFFADTEGLRYVLPGAGGAIWIPTTQYANYVLANVNGTTPGSLPFYQNIFNLYSTAPGANRAVAATPSDDAFLGCGLASQANGGITGFGALTTDAQGNPTSWGTPCAQQFRSTQNNLNTEWLLTVRGDWIISNKDKASIRFKTDHGVQATGTDPINPAFNANSVQPEYEGQINETHTFGSTAVNNFIASGMWYSAIFGPPNFAQALKTFPTVVAFNDGLFTQLGGADNAYPQGRVVTQYMFTDTFTKSMGHHQLGFGGNFRRNLVSDYTTQPNISGIYTLSSMMDFTTGVFDPGQGDIYTQAFPRVGAVQVKLFNLGLYGQDVWKATSKLTLTMALRADITGNPGCKQNCYNRLIAPFNNLAHDPTVPYNQVIKTGLNQAFQGMQTVSWQPRIGVAYNLFPNTVIRGGFGLFSDLFPATLVDRFIVNAPNVYTAAAGSVGTIAFGTGNSARDQAAASSQAFQQGFASGATYAQLASSVPGFAAPVYSNMSNQLDQPQFMEWNGQIEQQLGRDYSVSVNYVGNHGYNVMTIDPFSNAYCSRHCVNGFFGTPSQGLIPQGKASSDIRFQQINSVYNQGWSNYNGLTTSFKMRYGSQFQANFNYTWSHAMDTCSNNCLLPFTANNVVSLRYTTSPLLPGTSYGNSDYDVRQNFSANYVWNTKSPWANSFSNMALGNWVIAGTIFYHSGYGYSPVNTSVRGNLGNVTGLRTGTPLGYFLSGPINQGGCNNPNINCQTQDQFMQSPLNPTLFQSNFGNIARNSLHGPGYFDTDMSILKNFKIKERMTLSAGANFFNLFNHPNFDLPVNSVTAGDFGQIIDTVMPATTPYGAFAGVTLSGRIIQLNARLSF